MMNKKSNKRLAAIGAVLLSGAFVTGSMFGANLNSLVYAEETVAETEAENYVYSGSLKTTYIDASEKAPTVLPDVSDVAEAALSSVVSITNNIEITQTSNGYGYGSIYDQFFGWGNSNQGQPQTQTQQSQAFGSGVIIDEDGENLLIVTNNHVAVYDESGNSAFYSYTASSVGLTVTFVDGTTVDAELKGTDSAADLAILAVPMSSLSAETLDSIRIAALGNSDAMKVGQGVIAIGNALGRGQTTTVGYISALNREVTASDDNITRSLMQIDAAINSGNSGGGLFNSNGELIGINEMKTKEVGVEGMGFAIPISSVEDIINRLKTEVPRTVLAQEDRGYLGIIGEDVGTNRVNYGYPAGAVILSITENSPAETAGLQIGDVITAVNSTKVSTYDELRGQLAYYAPDETITLTVSRINGRTFEEISVNVTLANRDSIVQ